MRAGTVLNWPGPAKADAAKHRAAAGLNPPVSTPVRNPAPGAAAAGATAPKPQGENARTAGRSTSTAPPPGVTGGPSAGVTPY